MTEMETTPFGATHHVWTDEEADEERVGVPVVDAGTRERRALGIDQPDADATVTRRRAAIEERLPTDATPGSVRRFVPGEWVYELTHPDGRVETLTEERYHALLAAQRAVLDESRERAERIQSDHHLADLARSYCKAMHANKSAEPRDWEARAIDVDRAFFNLMRACGYFEVDA